MKKKRDYTARTAFRLPAETRSKIAALITTGKYKNLSHAVRAALALLFEKEGV
ncbi:MAG: hypothetical protein ACQXXJ_02220 [Candidatus Bathyarchaeia archaeon]